VVIIMVISHWERRRRTRSVNLWVFTLLALAASLSPPPLEEKSPMVASSEAQGYEEERFPLYF
jgi:hypothetical protein